MAATPTLAKIMSRMTDMELEEVEKDFLSLIYGSYGTGKTTLAQGIAQALRGEGRILYLDSLQNYVSLENIPSLMRATDRIQVTDPRELTVLGNAMQKRAKGFQDYNVVVLDEVDSWFEVILHNYVREVTGTMPDQDLPEIEGKHYNAPTQAFLNVLAKFHSTPNLHVIMVAHEQERGKEPRNYIAPSLPPKLMKGINEKVHLVARLESAITKDGYSRQLQVNPSKQVVAKTRIGNLPVKLDFNKVPKTIKGWVGSTAQVADLTGPEPDPDVPDEADVETVEVEDDEAVEVEDED